MTSIAQNLLDNYKADTAADAYDKFFKQINKLAQEEDQDWTNETSTFFFSDGSCVAMSGSKITAA